MIQHHKVETRRTGHFYSFGSYSANTEYIWLACHGYGQAADRFIKKFEVLDSKKHFVLAPEGLSRFYWGGLDGHVVSSWMTRKDRLDEIDDYVNFLHNIMQPYLQKKVQFVFFGFSQGCATVLRYLQHHQPGFSHIILWAGSIPKDLDFDKMIPYFRKGKIHMIYGDNDEFLTPVVLNQELEFIYDRQIDFAQKRYHGRHRVDKKVLFTYVEEHLQ